MRDGYGIVEPGEVTTPHTHDGQEEVFVAMTAEQISVSGDVHDVPAGGVVRVHRETDRNLCNRTVTVSRWNSVDGAPPRSESKVCRGVDGL